MKKIVLKHQNSNRNKRITSLGPKYISRYEMLRRNIFGRIWAHFGDVFPPEISELTWDQAQFSFRFVNKIPAGKAKRSNFKRYNFGAGR